jgi:CubicO group peptidase (beta-lactamase class C family)
VDGPPDSDITVAEILVALKAIPPGSGFREEYGYDNLFYILAGEVLSRAGGKPWADIIRSRLYKPLGMKSCAATPSEAAKSRNRVVEHMQAPGTDAWVVVDPDYVFRDSAAAAGVYVDPWYGRAEISVRDGALYLDMGRGAALDAPLTPTCGDAFIARLADRTLNADIVVTFVGETAITGMTMKKASETTDFSFDYEDLAFVRQ